MDDQAQVQKKDLGRAAELLREVVEAFQCDDANAQWFDVNADEPATWQRIGRALTAAREYVNKAGKEGSTAATGNGIQPERGHALQGDVSHPRLRATTDGSVAAGVDSKSFPAPSSDAVAGWIPDVNDLRNAHDDARYVFDIETSTAEKDIEEVKRWDRVRRLIHTAHTAHVEASASSAPASDRTAAQAFVTAVEIACGAHAGQLDKGGVPYIRHPLSVAMRLNTWTERIVGVLHDVLEDGGCDAQYLRERGIPEECVVAVAALTRRSGESYDEAIDRVIAAGPLAMAVKLADLEENLRPDRQHPEAERLAPRYHKAHARIGEALGNLRAPAALSVPAVEAGKGWPPSEEWIEALGHHKNIDRHYGLVRAALVSVGPPTAQPQASREFVECASKVREFAGRMWVAANIDDADKRKRRTLDISLTYPGVLTRFDTALSALSATRGEAGEDKGETS